MTTTPQARPTLSVVIPVFNGASTLDQQLTAVLASIDDTMEVVVVDNRSTDNSAAIAQRFADAYPQVRLLLADDGQGASYARNTGVRTAHSDLIAFCDSDDEVAPGWARAALTALETCHYVTGPVDVDALNPAWLATSRGRQVFSDIPKTDLGTPFAHGCNMAMTRATFNLVGGFDETVKIGEDINFAIRAEREGVSLCWAAEMLVRYRMRTGALDRWRQAVAYGRARIQLQELDGASRMASLRLRLRPQARRLLWIVRTAPLLYRKAHRARWWWTVALVVGEIRGTSDRPSTSLAS